MENRFYKIKRDNVYVGKVVKLETKTEPYRSWNIESEIFETGLIANAYKPLRSMLFVPTATGFADDLLYKSQLYPALNIADHELCLNPYNNIVVVDCCRLAQLLKYLGYGEEVTFDDLVDLRNTVFTNQWAQDNCQLFGFEEKKPSKGTFSTLEEYNRAKRQYEKDKKWGIRTFIPSEDNAFALSKEYFHCLDLYGDPSWQESLIDRFFGIKSKLNAFKPSYDEPLAKSLSMRPIKKR